MRKSCDDPIRTEKRHVLRLTDEAAHEGDVISDSPVAVILALFQGEAVYQHGGRGVVDGDGWYLKYPFPQTYAQEIICLDGLEFDSRAPKLGYTRYGLIRRLVLRWVFGCVPIFRNESPVKQVK